MELTNETQVEQVETEEQKSKRRVPSYYLIHELVGNPNGLNCEKFATKKELKNYLEKNDLESRKPIVILGHEVPIQFNKIVKVDF